MATSVSRENAPVHLSLDFTSCCTVIHQGHIKLETPIQALKNVLRHVLRIARMNDLFPTKQTDFNTVLFRNYWAE